MSRKSGHRFSDEDMRNEKEPMQERGKGARASLLPGVAALALATAYLIALLAAEKQPAARSSVHVA